MSRQEFTARQVQAARQGSRVDVPGMVVLIAGIILFVPAVRLLCTCYPPGKVYCGAAVAMLIFLVGNYLLAAWAHIRRARVHGLTCPSCGCSLLGAHGAYVVATGHCKACDALIVSTPQPALG